MQKSSNSPKRRKSTRKSRSRKPCKSNQVRDRSTNRCRKKKTGHKSPRRRSSRKRKPCKSGQVRNKSTLRCRKKKSASRRRKSASRKKKSAPEKVPAVCKIDPKKLPDKMPKRISPPRPSAPCFEMGVFIGNDGGDWIVKKAGKSFRWFKHENNEDEWATV